MPPAAAPPVPPPVPTAPPLPCWACPPVQSRLSGGGGVIPARPRHGGLRQMSGIEDDEL